MTGDRPKPITVAIVDDHDVGTPIDEAFHEVRADETGPSGNKSPNVSRAHVD